MSIEIKAAQLDKAEVFLYNVKNGVPRAISAAFNRTAEGIRTDSVRKVRDTYDIKAGDVRKTLRITRSSPSNLFAVTRSSGGAIPLVKFKVRPGKPTKRPPAVLTVSVKKSGGKPIPGAFISQMGSGHIGVFERVGKPRLPIKELYGPPVPVMLDEPGVRQHIESQAVIRLEKRLDHEILRLLGGD